MLKLFENGELYTPERLGRKSLLLADSKIGKVGEVDASALEKLGVEHEVVDVTGCVVTPGFIDPHIHLLGGSGETGFSSQTPEFFLSEIVRNGFTTVVGTLGVDTTMKTMAGLLAKVKGLKEEGLNAYLWTGGYNVPPASVMASVREDIMYLDEVIGAGEIAISDLRAMEPAPRDLAWVVTDCYVGGMLAGKSKRAHFHVGDREGRLKPLRDLVESFDVQAEWLYATHVERSEALMREAIELVELGAAVDIDVVEEDLAKWLRFYRDNDGDPSQLTVSSDAAITSPRLVLEQIRECVLEEGMALEEMLPLVTSNTARILELRLKGRLEVGRWMVRDGKEVVTECFLKESNRRIHLVGKKP